MFEVVVLAPYNFMLGFSLREKRFELFCGLVALCYDWGEKEEQEP